VPSELLHLLQDELLGVVDTVCKSCRQRHRRKELFLWDLIDRQLEQTFLGLTQRWDIEGGDAEIFAQLRRVNIERDLSWASAFFEVAGRCGRFCGVSLEGDVHFEVFESGPVLRVDAEGQTGLCADQRGVRRFNQQGSRSRVQFHRLQDFIWLSCHDVLDLDGLEAETAVRHLNEVRQHSLEYARADRVSDCDEALLEGKALQDAPCELDFDWNSPVVIVESDADVGIFKCPLFSEVVGQKDQELSGGLLVQKRFLGDEKSRDGAAQLLQALVIGEGADDFREQLLVTGRDKANFASLECQCQRLACEGCCQGVGLLTSDWADADVDDLRVRALLAGRVDQGEVDFEHLVLQLKYRSVSVEGDCS